MVKVRRSTRNISVRNSSGNENNNGGAEVASMLKDDVVVDSKNNFDNSDSEEDNEEEKDEDEELYIFGGKSFGTYQEMVNAKRKRNEEMLKNSGLLELSSSLVESSKTKKNGINSGGLAAENRKRKKKIESLPTRKSNRRRGIPADGNYVEDERGGRFQFAVADGNKNERGTTEGTVEEEKEKHFKDRVNDGSGLSVSQAVELCAEKWVQENTVSTAQQFVHKTLKSLIASSLHLSTTNKRKRSDSVSVNSSPTSVLHEDMDEGNQDEKTAQDDNNHSAFRSNQKTEEMLLQQIERLSIEDENMVAKVTPERIYSVAIHPSTDALIVGAGDKNGYIGLWNVNQYSASNPNNTNVTVVDSNETDADGVHLFRVHKSVVNSLQWTKNGDALLSSSYDGTVRWLDVQSETFEEIFATYDDDSLYAEELGFGLDEGYSYWTQYCTLQGVKNNANEKCFFLSTNTGMVYHIDRRIGAGKITFQEQLSQKKINSLSVHPNGYCLASAGLDCCLNLWDIRKFGYHHMKKSQKFKDARIDIYTSRKSINSAFFSPSGSKLVATTMNNKLDIYYNAHLSSSKKTSKSTETKESLYHDNHTGRWLTTFMAQWHPTHDVFLVGSMGRPRGIDIYSALDDKDNSNAASCKLIRNVQGSALGSVVSRCCFHPNDINNLTLIGGNSSGRVTVVKEYGDKNQM